ncbi:hypothetical protein [Nocardioides sp.]|uniref:hypothetical protein n=1 Tax=Nocardioides sp. TaxID=35761 RepID=UPI002ED7D334
MSGLTLSREKQRFVVGLALWILAAVAILLVPNDGAGAVNSIGPNYQPLQCSQGTNTQQRRQTVNLSNDSVNGEISGTNAYPCLAGVPWKFEAGLNNFSTGNGTAQGTQDPYVIARVDGIYAKNPDNDFYYAASGSAPLYQIAFKALNLCSGSGQPVSGCELGVNNLDGNNRNDVALYASSAGTPDPKPAKPYVLRFAPDGPITLGGNGVITDVIADGASSFSVGPENITAGGTGCQIAGGTKYHNNDLFATMHTCQGIKLESMAGLAWILGVQTFYIKQLNLSFQYLITHGGTTTDPYSDPPGGVSSPLTSVQLPNTRITVCQTTARCDPSLDYPNDD